MTVMFVQQNLTEQAAHLLCPGIPFEHHDVDGKRERAPLAELIAGASISFLEPVASMPESA